MPDINDGARYIITNVKGGTVADLSGEDNRSVIGFPRNGGENQQWEFVRVENGWNIKNVASGLYLQLDGPTNDNTTVIATEEPRLWHVWEDEEDTSAVRICVPDTRQNLDLADHGNPAPGTPVTIWGRWEGKNQIWTLDQV